MNRSSTVVVFLLLCVCCFSLACQYAPAAEQKGWQPLFNGKDLAGWQNASGGQPGAGWVVEERAMVRKEIGRAHV